MLKVSHEIGEGFLMVRVEGVSGGSWAYVACRMDENDETMRVFVGPRPPFRDSHVCTKMPYQTVQTRPPTYLYTLGEVPGPSEVA